ncbi:hypothetical protein J4Q44_G00383770 [Coregonus suidteri]|uniref:Uncharacterized protein n=1 Tax=Coregonus suidteri TaxID=861788 RepID=A0AAN8KID8_9TELE
MGMFTIVVTPKPAAGERQTQLNHITTPGPAQLQSTKMVRLLLSRGANINAFDKKDRRAIHWAAYMGHIEVVKLLASHGSEVSCKDKKAYTPLHSAASSGMISVVKYLLDLGVDDVVVNELIECGANVNQVYEKGFAPLHFTAASRHGALCLELLVGNGALVNIKSKDGKTPLHMTAIHGRFSRSQAIIQNGAEIDCEDKNGNTPLHISARYGHELLINTLITNGADTSKRGVHGMFPLHLSALSGFSDCCRKLLSSGFDIDTPDDFGRTCLHAAAAANGKPQGQDILNDSDVRAPISPLHLAAYHGHHHAMEGLVQSLLDLDVRNSQGRTPLDLAAFKGHVECVDVLINQGASILVKDFHPEEDPIHAAGECVEALLQHSASFLVRDCKGRTPVHLAAASGHIGVVPGGSYTPPSQWRPSPSSQTTRATTPYTGACYNGHDTCVEVLLEQEVFQPKTEGNSFSPLHCAVINDNEGAVEMLIDHSGAAIVHATDTKKPGTPCMRRLFTDTWWVSSAAASHNAQVTPPMPPGKTSLMMAAENGQSHAVEMLVSSAKAELTPQDAVKNTALNLACSKAVTRCSQKCSDTVVVQELLVKGASVLAVDENGYTPDWACAPNKDVADCLARILAHHDARCPATRRPACPSVPLNHLHNSPSKSCDLRQPARAAQRAQLLLQLQQHPATATTMEASTRMRNSTTQNQETY